MKRKSAIFISLIMTLCMLFSFGCGGAAKDDARWLKLSEKERSVSMIASTDDFGRTFSLSGEKDGEKYVGMFFFTLHGAMPYTNIYDVTEITENGKNMDEFYKKDSSPSDGTAHFWGKPLWDYYSQADPWVIAKQLEMLTMAGVDFLFIDVTNGFTQKGEDGYISSIYEKPTYAVMEMVHKYVEMGWNVPRLMFYTNNNGTNGTKNSQCEEANDDINVVRELYNKFYKYENGKYDDVWFKYNGKPLIIMTRDSYEIMASADEESVEYEMSEYFEFKFTIWPNDSSEDPNDLKQNTFPWMEKYFNGNYLKNRNGVVNVSVAQHMNTIRFSDLDKNYGRGYNYETGKNNSADSSKGTNYEYLWKQVIDSKSAVNMVTLTGWNEWVGGKFWDANQKKAYMVDCFNEEYSRDIEPTYGAYKDNFYLQTARNIRSYKFGEKFKLVYPEKSIDLNSFDVKAWEKGKVYCDFTGECAERNFSGWIQVPSTAEQPTDYKILTDNSNRNDIDTVTVTHDKDYIYFRITAVAPITDYVAGDNGWMNILLQTDPTAAGNLFGYNYFINREVADGRGSVCKRTAGGEYEKIGEVLLSKEDGGRVLQVAVPRSVLGMNGGTPEFVFKVCDNIQKPEEILSYYNTGDSAPIGRLGYVYGM